VWHGRRDVRAETVSDPAIEEPTDAIVRVTSSGISGSDLPRGPVKIRSLSESERAR
jgi:threonine dehydrogenase-like Zn-dependent dehydrogenase